MALSITEKKISGYERVIFGKDPERGLDAIIAIHHLGRGPACGGIRLLPYANSDEALTDVLRLSRGMSYKSALANVGFGGGKAVMIADPKAKHPQMFQAMGELVETLGGEYIAAKDMNVTSEDLLQVRNTTKHVLGIETVPGSSGDPSPMTAHGLFRALEATVDHLYGSRYLHGLKVAVQGIGHVGYRFAQKLFEAGAEVWVTDTDPEVVSRAGKELKAKSITLENIYDLPVDVFSPCARGAILNSSTVPRLKCRAVVGAANNQLATEVDGFRLHESHILYAPDYAVNSGGIINIFIEYENGKYEEAKAMTKTDGIFETMKEIFLRSKSSHRPPFVVADELAVERLQAAP